MNLLKSDYQMIKNWMYRNARPLDIARWQYQFENGSKEAVLKSLLAYQNEDGGFGNAIEADSWNPNSSPYSTADAIIILEEIKFNDGNHPVIRGMLRYLDNTTDFTGKHWLSVICTNNDYAHAPWWTYADNFTEDWGYTPTAIIAGFILCFADKNTEIYKKAEKIASDAIDKYLFGIMPNGEAYRAIKREGEINCYHHLLKCLEAGKLTHLYKISELKDALKNQAQLFIERDTSKWDQYCCKPSVFVTSPHSLFFKGNEEIINAELNYILNKRNEQGVWDITWSWGAYEKEFTISENWWKANIVISNMLLLKNFNRL
ncbi:hypothetical protein [Clostridium tagluense]|uniref:hypothetical protein n=1 Tax=Clostridium tagluense TaxID=360422 RepID=UPI001C0E831F|nr:hypothetical protein [Clostridium tagluense]MBU3130189.1 hypothetical protein [Clostridium tagluense]